LSCHQQDCTLEVTPPGSRTITVVFARTQLHSAQSIKTDKAGTFLQIDNDKYEPPHRGKGKGKYQKYSNHKGPDAEGRYRTYRIKFLPHSPDRGTDSAADADAVVADGDFTPVMRYLTKEDDGTYGLHFRHFGLAQSRTRIRSNVNKVDSYVKKRRQKLLLKESATLPWQGILCLIFGLLGFLLTLLIGQFYDEPPRRQGGPGARRSTPGGGVGSGSQTTRPKPKPTFVYDSGRPSKYPPGYRPQKKY
jgi:hypothetical protein